MRRTRRKPVLGGSMAPCSCAQACAHGKTGVGRRAQPARGMPRAHGANGPAQPTRPPLDGFLRARMHRTPRQEQGQKQKQSQELRLRLLPLNLNLNLIFLLPATRREKKAQAMLEADGHGGSAEPLAPWMAPSSLHGRIYSVFCAAPMPIRPRYCHRVLYHPVARNKKKDGASAPSLDSPRAAGSTLHVSWDQLARPPPPPWPRPRPPPLPPPPRRWP